MIAVVADTAPLRYLIQIDCDQFLPILFTKILVPFAVWQELQDPKTPAEVRQWAEQLPPWLEVRKVNLNPTGALAQLDAGEREAIQLAEELGANLLLLDERTAARIARERGLIVTGTLGVLLETANSVSFQSRKHWLGWPRQIFVGRLNCFVKFGSLPANEAFANGKTERECGDGGFPPFTRIATPA